ncbi:MAG: DUF4177 domain-containing protein [Pseudomonadota bacterium]
MGRDTGQDMQTYEYKVVAAPRKARRAKGARTPQDRFARTLTDVINAEAASGWEYLRAESLPVDEKKGMLSSATESYHSVLVFRKPTTPDRALRQQMAAPVAPQAHAPASHAAGEPPKPTPLPLGPASRSE